MPIVKAYKPSRFAEKEFKPYVIAIGQVALTWNDLHEALAELFVTVMGGGWTKKILSVWNSAGFDRPKRKMLEGAINHMDSMWATRRPKMVADVMWLLQRADDLEEARNNCIHSPLLLLGGLGRLFLALAQNKPPNWIVPQTIRDNPRAKKLAQKDLLSEFRWCRDAAVVLIEFSARIDIALADDREEWPDRPKMPNRGQQKARRRQRRKAAPK